MLRGFLVAGNAFRSLGSRDGWVLECRFSIGVGDIEQRRQQKKGGEKERERGRSNIDSFMLFCAGVVLETRVPLSAVLVGGPKRGPCFRELPIF